MTETTQIDAVLLGYGPAEPIPILDTPTTVSSTQDDSSSDNDSHAAKTSLRKLMVSCIDSALEELGPLGDISQDPKNCKPQLPPVATNTSNTSKSMPSAEELYGYGSPSKVCPELQLRGHIRAPRYQRRNSVTKFSLSSALKQVQKEDLEGKLKPAPSSPLWQHLYAKMDKVAHREPGPALKRTALNFHTTVKQALAVEGPAAKRRRGCV